MTAWSIFDLPNGQSEAALWAHDALVLAEVAPLGPVVQVVFDQLVSEGGGGRWNPPNCGPLTFAQCDAWSLPFRIASLTGEQYGGGAADYADRLTGMQATVNYWHMSNYAAVLSAARRGAADEMRQAIVDSPWASSHYGWGANFSRAPLPASPLPPVKPWPWATNIVRVHGHAQTWARRLTDGHVDAKTQVPDALSLTAEQMRQKAAGHNPGVTWLMDVQHNLDQLTALPTVTWT